MNTLIKYEYDVYYFTDRKLITDFWFSKNCDAKFNFFVVFIV